MTRKHFFIFLIVLLSSFILPQSAVQAESWKDVCPQRSGLRGWWGAMHLQTNKCGDSFYTWNTTARTLEESWYESSAHYIFCGYSSFRDPGYVSAKVFIPSPDSKQTRFAHYFRWSTKTWLVIGSVDQYNTFGWAYLYRNDWDAFHTFKITDWTSNEAKYTKHVDFDAFGLTCP